MIRSEWRDPDGSIHYRKYLESADWRRFREAYWKRNAQGVCARCGIGNQQHCAEFGIKLHLHHRTYETLGFEADEDLEPVCKNCQDLERGERGPGWITGERELAPEEYWSKAKTQIAERRRTLGKELVYNQPELWKQLKRLDWLEDFVRACEPAAPFELPVDAWISILDAQPNPHDKIWCVAAGTILRASFDDVFWSETEDLLRAVSHWSRQEEKPEYLPGELS